MCKFAELVPSLPPPPPLLRPPPLSTYRGLFSRYDRERGIIIIKNKKKNRYVPIDLRIYIIHRAVFRSRGRDTRIYRLG